MTVPPAVMNGPGPLVFEYTRAGPRPLRAVVRRPSPGIEDHQTAVLMLHGGGWRGGDPADVATRAAALAGHGFTTIAIEYSLVGERPWPASVDDLDLAVRWVGANAAGLGVRGDVVALQGFSAGAHIALLYTLSGPGRDHTGPGPRVGALISCYAPSVLRPAVVSYRVTDLRAPVDLRRLLDQGPGLPAWLLLGENDGDGPAARASPLPLTGHGLPPISIVHGTDDRVVGVQDAIDLAVAWRAAGAPVELHLHAGQIHEFDAAPGQLGVVQAQVALFLRANLVHDPVLRVEQRLSNPLSALHESEELIS